MVEPRTDVKGRVVALGGATLILMGRNRIDLSIPVPQQVTQHDRVGLAQVLEGLADRLVVEDQRARGGLAVGAPQHTQHHEDER